MYRYSRFRFACVAAVPLLLAPAEASAQSERTAVLATVQRLFDRMAAHDTLALRATLTPEGRFFVIRVDSAGPVCARWDH
jgi:hypothetical protein